MFWLDRLPDQHVRQKHRWWDTARTVHDSVLKCGVIRLHPGSDALLIYSF